MHPHILEYWVFVHAGSDCVLYIPSSPNQGTLMYLICRQTKDSIVCEPLTLKFWCHHISVLSCHHHPPSMLTIHMTGLQHLMILHHITMSYLSALWSYKLLRWPPAVFTHRKNHEQKCCILHGGIIIGWALEQGTGNLWLLWTTSLPPSKSNEFVFFLEFGWLSVIHW